MSTKIAQVVLALTLAWVSAAGAAPVPAAGTPVLFASGVPGPEGLAFERGGRSLVVGTSTGDLLRFAADGSSTLLASVGESLAGITVLRDGRILAASFGEGRVWSVDPVTGFASIYASGVPGVNWIVQTKRGRVLASLSLDGTIVDITGGAPLVRASDLSFPNGMALRGDGHLYVAQTGLGNVVRLPVATDGTLGAPTVWATGIPGVDGIGFDRRGNLLAVGGDTLWVVPAAGGAASVLSTDPLLDWPASLAFGGAKFGRRNIYLVNYGLPLGSGTTIVRVPYSMRGAKLIR
jgi:sugar lactone lactonase YvrE